LSACSAQPVRVEPAVDRDVEVLPADHAEGRVGKLARDPASDSARPAEGLGQERVAGQDGHVLAEADVSRWLPAPQVVVIERGRSSCTRLKCWTSSSEQPAGRSFPRSRPSASPVARQSTGRMRFPPPSSE
jgi:hypothetical protein